MSSRRVPLVEIKGPDGRISWKVIHEHFMCVPILATLSPTSSGGCQTENPSDMAAYAHEL